MTAQVQKLEELLVRVQHNRVKPRTAPVAEPKSTVRRPISDVAKIAVEQAPLSRPKVTQIEPPGSFNRLDEVMVSPLEPQRIQQPSPVEEALSARRPAQKRIGTPLEVAVEGHVDSVVAPIVELESGELAAEQTSADAAQPIRMPIAPMVKPAQAVIDVVSSHPVVRELTFGILLKRTLSLRPR